MAVKHTNLRCIVAEPGRKRSRAYGGKGLALRPVMPVNQGD